MGYEAMPKVCSIWVFHTYLQFLAIQILLVATQHAMWRATHSVSSGIWQTSYVHVRLPTSYGKSAEYGQRISSAKHCR